MIIVPNGNTESALTMASKAELLEEMARRHNDAPYVLVIIDPERGLTVYETIGTDMTPPDMLKSLAHVIEAINGDSEMTSTEIEPF